MRQTFDNDSETSVSGFIFREEEGLMRKFTDMETVSACGFNVIVKAKRYGRLWILKGLKDDVRQSKAYITLLKKEFDILMMMQHPGIAAASGFEHIDGLGPCIVMEWIDGVTLKEWLKGRHAAKERLNVAVRLMDALEYVHGKQVAHRDLKPQNIMVTRNGQHVKLIDFGLSDTDSYLIYKQPAGTEGYMSPEQAVGRQTDIRNDIYSLGCVLADLKPGYVFRGVVRKCKAGADKRYKSVAEVKRAFRRYSYVKTWIAVCAAVIAVVTGIAFIIVERNGLVRQNEKTAMMADSLNHKIHELETAKAGYLNATSDSVNGNGFRSGLPGAPVSMGGSDGMLTHNKDSLQREIDRLNSELGDAKASIQDEDLRRKVVEDAIGKGKKEMLQIVERCNLDEINTYGKYAEVCNAAIKQLYEFWLDYPQSLGDNVSDGDRSNVQHALAMYYQKLVTPLLDRQTRLREQDKSN